jgi:hypothetical protein
MLRSYLASALFMILGVFLTGVLIDTTIFVLNFLMKEGVF